MRFKIADQDGIHGFSPGQTERNDISDNQIKIAEIDNPSIE